MKITKINASLLILAGGLGSRYQGKKQLDSMGPSGECLMEYSIYDAKRAGFSQVVLIINDYFDNQIKEHFNQIAKNAEIALDFVVQIPALFLPEKHQNKLLHRTKPWGTAHAILAAKHVISNPFVVINADDCYNRMAFQKAYELIALNKITPNQYAMVAYPLFATLSTNGSVSRGVCTIENQLLNQVVEHTNIIEKNGKIVGIGSLKQEVELEATSLVSMNFWIFSPSIFKVLETKFEAFLSSIESDKTEFYIPSVVNEQIQKNVLKVFVETSNEKWFGVTYPEDKNLVVRHIQELVDNGIYPEALWKNE